MAEERTTRARGATAKDPPDEPRATPETDTEADMRKAEPVDRPADPQQIETEIEQTREELGETVAALAEKANVKKQAKQKLDETKDKAREVGTQTAASARQGLEDMPNWASDARSRATAAVREHPVAVAGVAGMLLLLLIRRSR
jgi:ElaB/YqjD/DUF883 family membrane-anchored ribosome-binding protein